MTVVDEIAAVLHSLRGVWDEDSLDELDHALQAAAPARENAAKDPARQQLCIDNVLTVAERVAHRLTR